MRLSLFSFAFLMELLFSPVEEHMIRFLCEVVFAKPIPFEASVLAPVALASTGVVPLTEVL